MLASRVKVYTKDWKRIAILHHLRSASGPGVNDSEDETGDQPLLRGPR